VFENKDYGGLLENALRSIWMHTYMKTIIKLDSKLAIKAKAALNYNESTLYSNLDASECNYSDISA
jgi:hypothetical protein